jgi:flavin-dependent dehydrogenase
VRSLATDGVFDARAVDPRTSLLVEAAEHGWWYAMPLPGNRTLVGYVTDRLVWTGGEARANHFSALVSATRHVRERVGTRRLLFVRGRACPSAVLSRCAGDSWAAVGDAAALVDPLSGAGIRTAVQTGRVAAKAIAASLNGDLQALAGYQARRRAEFLEYANARRAHYGLETRWSDRLFWQRRTLRSRAEMGSLDERLPFALQRDRDKAFRSLKHGQHSEQEPFT